MFYLDPIRFESCEQIKFEAVVRFNSSSSKQLPLTRFNPRNPDVIGCLFLTIDNEEYIEFLAQEGGQAFIPSSKIIKAIYAVAFRITELHGNASQPG